MYPGGTANPISHGGGRSAGLSVIGSSSTYGANSNVTPNLWLPGQFLRPHIGQPCELLSNGTQSPQYASAMVTPTANQLQFIGYQHPQAMPVLSNFQHNYQVTPQTYLAQASYIYVEKLGFEEFRNRFMLEYLSFRLKRRVEKIRKLALP
ncbi:unnamed protein product [Protopolystoma xenopodis]|uniref:Uncharacterized protein n=1 Tax=Protopolystoma xenopodis TaxID=117903 RepID=A0A448X906_9PLAT|nr:unnamed protein product [Protopolystoma xenopodis]